MLWNRSTTYHSRSFGGPLKMHHPTISMEKSLALRRCSMLMTKSVNAAWWMTWTQRILRLPVYHYSSIRTRLISPTLELLYAGQSTCSSEVNPSTSGLCPPLLPVTTSHTYHQCIIFKMFTFSPNVFTRYQTAFKNSTRNSITQLQWPPPWHTAIGSSYKRFCPYWSMTDLLTPTNMGSYLSAEMVIPADYSRTFYCIQQIISRSVYTPIMLLSVNTEMLL